MLVGSFGAERELAVESTSNEHVVDLAVERQRQRVRAAVRLVRRLPSTNHERTVLQSTPTADVELGHWVTGSYGSGSPGHHFDPVCDPSFSGFRKNAENAKRTFEMLK